MSALLGKYRSYLMGFAILWIMGLHFYMYSAFPSDSVWGILFSKGYLGVDIFLFLSAYGLCHSFKSRNLLSFYGRRLKRLYPMYAVFLLVAIFFYGSTYEETAWQLFLFQGTGLAAFRQTDFEWYIPALIAVYALFPLMFKAVSWLYHKFKAGIPLLAIVLSVLSPWLSRFIFPLFAQRLPIVVLGIATYLSLNAKDGKFIYLTFAVCALFSIGVSVGIKPDYSLMIPGILALLSVADKRLPFKKVMSFFGEHSLEIYLAQSFALNQFFYKCSIPYAQKCLIAFSIIAAGSLLLFFVQKGFWKLVERGSKH